MIPVEILPIQENIILRGGGSELLILAAHVRKLQDLKNPRDFSQYFRGEALVNRPARKLFEAWLRKDQSLWPRIYKSVQGITFSEMTPTEGEPAVSDQAPNMVEPSVAEEMPVLKSPEVSTPSELKQTTAKPKSKKTATSDEEKPKATKKADKVESTAKTKKLDTKPKSAPSKSVPKETGKVKKKG